MSKNFLRGSDGRDAYLAERLADIRLASYPWKVPIHQWRDEGFDAARLPAESRLDKVAAGLGPEERRHVAGEALSIILDLQVERLAHRDFHSHNLFWLDGQLRLIDFEATATIECRTPLPEAYDVTGRGLPSPLLTSNMGYAASWPKSVSSVLGIPLEAALDALRERLRSELRDASLSFQRARNSRSRHTCISQLIYCTMSVPGFEVGRDLCQRDATLRVDQFGLTEDVVRGSRVLDLGSNVGGTSCTLAQRGAKMVLGLEYDEDKVRISRRVAAFGGLDNIHYRCADLDSTSADDLPGPFDFVLALAIDAHVAQPDRLFELLGAVTERTLAFEGNGGCDLDDVESKLRAVGFVNFERLGMCLDDIREENNIRPLMLAHKPSAVSLRGMHEGM